MGKAFHFNSSTFVLSWYFTVVSTFVFALILLVHLSFPHQVTTPVQPQYQMYKALPADSLTNRQEIAVGKLDGRAIILNRFFKDKKSPLATQAQVFVDTADKYGLDYALMPAIAMQESNGGKRMPSNSYNPFGYGIYGQKVMRFANFEEAIERVGLGLKKDYFDQGLQTPDEIMPKYTPPSVKKGGPWAIAVTSFMSELH